MNSCDACVAHFQQIKQEKPSDLKAYNDILLYQTQLHQQQQQLQQQQQQQQDEINATIDNDAEMYCTIDGKNYKIVRKGQQQQLIQVDQIHQNDVNSSYAAGSTTPALTVAVDNAVSPHVIVYKTGSGGGAESPALRRNIAGAGSPASATVAYSSEIQSTPQQQQQLQK